MGKSALAVREEGKLARRAGVLPWHNPYFGYKEHELLAREWWAGWLEEDDEETPKTI